MHLIKNLKHLLDKHQLTYLMLSYRTEIGKKTIAHWFSRKQLEPCTLHLKKLSDYFKVSIDYICMEDITVMDKREVLNNYNLIQKRLK